MTATTKGHITFDTAQIFMDTACRMFNQERVIEVDSTSDPLEQVSPLETLDDVWDEGGMYVKAWVWVGVADLKDEERRTIFADQITKQHGDLASGEAKEFSHESI